MQPASSSFLGRVMSDLPESVISDLLPLVVGARPTAGLGFLFFVPFTPSAP